VITARLPVVLAPWGTRLGRQRFAELARLSTARLLCLAAPTRGRPRGRHLQRISPSSPAVRRYWENPGGSRILPW